jgi:hypothetical protein
MEKQDVLNKYMVIVANGPTPPKAVHLTAHSAYSEAKRLHAAFGQDVAVLKIVAVIKKEQVPVVKTKTVEELSIIFKNELNNTDDLPF